MDKAYIEQAAEEFANQAYPSPIMVTFREYTKLDFIAGVEWLLSVQEEIATQQLLKNAKQ
jgi:hypothetical protein